MYQIKDFYLRLILLCIGLHTILSAQAQQATRFVKIYPDSIPLTGVALRETASGFDIEQEKKLYGAPFLFQELTLNEIGDSLDAAVVNIPAEGGFDPVFKMADGSFARCAINSFRIQRFTADGVLFWDSTYTFPNVTLISTPLITGVKMMAMTADGDILLGFGANATIDYHVARFDGSTMALKWVQKVWNFGSIGISVPIDERFIHFVPVPGGGVALTLRTNGGGIYTLFYLSPNGETLWKKSYQLPPVLVKSTPEGNIWISKRETDGSGRLIQYDNTGQVMFDKKINQIVVVPPPYNGLVTSLIEMPDSTLVVAGHYSDYQDVFFMRMTRQGAILWFWQGALYSNATMLIRAGIPCADGGFAWTGHMNQNTLLIKTDEMGRPTTNYVSGYVRWDQNTNCVPDSIDSGLEHWLVQLRKPSGVISYGVSDANGRYSIPIGTFGNYTVRVLPPNFIWDACTEEYPVSLPQGVQDSTIVQDFSAQHGYDCPYMSVNLAAPFLRRCFENYIAIQCCNDGVMDAPNAAMDVILPHHLTPQSASVPYTQNGDTLHFELDTFYAQSCRNITLTVIPDCDSTENGQALCMTARIFPDTFCAPIPGWSGALIEVSAACEQDSVHFNIQNVGDSPSQTLNYIVIDDHVMTLQGDFSLLPGASKEISSFASGGTIRLIANQEPNAPGAPMPSVAVEGCGDAASFSSGMVVQWPNENGSPFTDTKCWEIRSSFDPNDKIAFPQGVQSQHYIQALTPIDYLIRFQNTGNDTAFKVVIRDFLSPWLNITSVKPGASSHPYIWTIEGTNTLVFTFDNILLPDSNTNLPASMGFIQFQIEQKPNLFEGVVINNQANIFFDFNAPIATNTTFLTFKKVIIPPLVTSVQPLAADELAPLEVWPNPAQSMLWVKIPFPKGELILLNAQGQAVIQQSVQGNSSILQRGTLPAGVYWLYWKSEQGQSRFKSIIWK